MAKSEHLQAVYADFASDGHYQPYHGGLRGKHDNVRIYWEDQIRAMSLRPHLRRLVDRKTQSGNKVRVVDLGAGTGEGLRLLTSVMRKESDLRLNQTRILPMDMIEQYVGCDLCESMVEQGNVAYASCPNVVFRQGDFSKGFPLKDEQPFDLYFCSYGSFSHIGDDAMERLFGEIAEHAGQRALVVGEWLGRHSIEWPCYWDEPGEAMLDYSMSWLSADAEGEAEHFPMRFWLGDEIRALVQRAAQSTGAQIRVLDLYDCSVFVGRHVDTQEYNEWVSPVRAVVNNLHEANVRTDLERLKVEVVPVPGHDGLNSYFAKLKFCWNNLVNYCQRRLEKRQHPVQIRNWRRFPLALQMAIMTLDRVVDAVSWMRMGDPRANIIEPQLGYCLRNLEYELQEGAGRGHSLVGIFEVDRRAED